MVAMLVLAASLALAASAGAAPPEFVLRIPDAEGEPGNGAGELAHPRAIAANPSAGHVFVSEFNNARISEFTAWGSFVKAWGWGVANGAEEPQTCGPAEPEATPPPGLCQKGKSGSGKGQLLNPTGLAVDPAGNVYVFEFGNLRVQKFSSEGKFLLMFGGEVNKTKVEEAAPEAQQNVCPVAPTDVCQVGTEGAGPSHFTSRLGNYIAYSPTANAILVGDEGRIQKFKLDGSFEGEIPFTGALEAFKGKSVNALDVDPSGNIYISLSGTEDLFKLSASGEPLNPGKPGFSKFKVGDPLAVAVDDSGNVYAIDDPPGDLSGSVARVFEFDATGTQLVPTKEEEEKEELFPGILFRGPALNGLATNICAGSDAPGNLYVAAFSDGALSYVDAFGTGPVGCEEPPKVPPDIKAQYAAAVSTESATLRAQINPRFWKDTTFFVEFGEGKCSEGGCNESLPAPPGILTSKVINKAVTSPGVLLAGLEPGRTYHYRFVVESGGGGPVVGEEHSFRTFALPSAPPKCANEEFRSGPGARLPDCRAYEMVSPLEKKNGDAALLPSTIATHELNQSSTSGERFTYASLTPFADPEAGAFVTQYLAGRDPKAGWSSKAISPPRSARPLVVNLSLNNDFKGFSADLCLGWLRHNSTATLAPEAIPLYPNLYRRDNCGTAATYEAISTVEPPSRPAEKYLVNVQGFSADGTQTIFLADDALTPDAPALEEKDPKELQLYEHGPNGLHYVCYLPTGEPSPTSCGAGMTAGEPDGNASSVQNAISVDGSRVFWTAYKGILGSGQTVAKPGKIYLRQNPDQEPTASGECSEAEPEKACTIAVSESVTPDKAAYWGAAADGSKAVFEVVEGADKDKLYEFDVASETAKPIAEGVLGPMGMSEDASQIYFASSKDLADGGTDGARNLYLYDASEESFSFIMALAKSDFEGVPVRSAAVDELPSERSSMVSDDGLHAAFSSTAPPPSGYDNLDAASSLPNEEAYLYDAGQDKLLCVSCNPTNARPLGENVNSATEPVWAAARLAKRRIPLHAPRVLSQDGRRLFFESHEALVARDTNGTWDVYQWEAPGAGDCDKAGSTFGEAAEGCVDLISSGESPAVSKFLDADPSGKNVFIGTQSSLIEVDFGSNDVYDARVGGGFPEPASPGPECVGEACQSPPAPPAEVTPASAAFNGPGSSPKGKPGCKRGTRKVQRKGKTRCVRKAKHKPSKRGNKGRRAAR